MIFLLFCSDLKHVMKYFHYLCKEMCTETHPFALSVLVFYPFFLKERAANQLFRELRIHRIASFTILTKKKVNHNYQYF